jgi:hypothetical protein
LIAPHYYNTLSAIIINKSWRTDARRAACLTG